MADDRAPDDARDDARPPAPAEGAFPTVMPESPPRLPASFDASPPPALPAPSEPTPPLPPVLAASAAPPPYAERYAGMDDEPVVAVTRAEPERTEVATPVPADIATPMDAGDVVAPLAPESGKTKKKHGSFLRELPVLLVIAFALALLIKAFLIQAFYIPSGSMEETLQIRDRVLVNKLVYRFRDIHRGEIVVFNGLDSFTPETIVPPPANAFDSARRTVLRALGLGSPGEKDFIKRVIGIPGDTVACCVDGKVTVNGDPIDEPYVFENDKREFGPEVVPEGELFVMGDHRGASDDSRAKGTVPSDKVIGRAFVVIWPPKHFKGLKVPPQLEGGSAALSAQPWSMAVLPPVLGLVGAVPLHLLQRGVRRRWRRRGGG